MKKIVYVLFSLIFAVNSYAQSQKELKQLFRLACDSAADEYILLKSGEKKQISSIQFTTDPQGAKGKVELADGKKMKFDGDEISACYTKDATYKLCSYMRSASSTGAGVYGMRQTLTGKSLAARKYKGAINVYFLRVTYTYNDRNGVHVDSDEIHFVEAANDGSLIELKNDSLVWNKVAGMVGRSKAAMQIITNLRRSYGKLIGGAGTVEGRLLEAVEVYNRDAAQGKLQD